MDTHPLRPTESPASGDLAPAAAQAPAVYERPQAQALVAADDPIMALIRDPTIDLERVKAVLALRREMKEEAAREAFGVAMAACKADIPQVVKNRKNTDNSAKYATLDQMGAAVDKIIAKHGFSTSFHPAPCAREGFLKVVCLVAHTGGHERLFEAELPTDAAGLKGGVNKTPIHAWKSTMTYGRRVLTEMIFDVKSTDDDDGNAAGGKTHAVITEEQVDELRGLIVEANSDPKDIPQFTEDMLAYVGAESVETLKPAQFAKAALAIKKQIAEERKAQAEKGRSA